MGIGFGSSGCGAASYDVSLVQGVSRRRGMNGGASRNREPIRTPVEARPLQSSNYRFFDFLFFDFSGVAEAARAVAGWASRDSDSRSSHDGAQTPWHST